MKYGFLCLLLLAGCVKRMPDADSTIVFVAKRVRTMDSARPTAEAIAWKHGKIVAVGGKAEVMEAAGAGAIVETFPDSVIIPGLVDSHAHVASLGRSLSVISLLAATSEEDAVKRVKAAPATAYQGEWLMGRGWDQNDWIPSAAEKLVRTAFSGAELKVPERYPTKASLDAIHPSTPVFLTLSMGTRRG